MFLDYTKSSSARKIEKLTLIKIKIKKGRTRNVGEIVDHK